MSPKYKALVTSASVAAMTIVPQLAFAADYKQTIKDIAGKANDLMIAIGYGILLLIAAIALIIIAKEVVKAHGSIDRAETKQHIAVCVAVVICCILAGFTPAIVNSITSLAGTGVSLGTIGGTPLS